MKKSEKFSQNKAREQGQILETILNSTSRARVLRIIRAKLADFATRSNKYEKFLIATPNPEIVLAAYRDKKLQTILNSAEISLPDGVGLAAAYKFLSLVRPKNIFARVVLLPLQGLVVGLAVLIKKEWLYKDLKIIKGREMFLDLVRLANRKGWRVFLLGGERDVASKTKQMLGRSLKKVEIEAHQGPMLDTKADPVSGKDQESEREAVLAINKFKPHLLFVAFGAPKQEKWLHKWLPRLDVGGAMVIGRTFDYITGYAKPPPSWLADIGLEWLWTLVTRPKRAGRVLAAFPIFPLKVFWSKLTRETNY